MFRCIEVFRRPRFRLSSATTAATLKRQLQHPHLRYGNLNQQNYFTSRARKRPSSYAEALAEKNRRVAIYMLSVAVGVIGASYASVPLYKVFCQVTGFGGTTQRADSATAAAKAVVPDDGGRIIRIQFASDVSSNLPWSFEPQQQEVRVVPGETALAFYTAVNKTDRAMTGIATYNVLPVKAGLYFQKIQCFCFDEQRLRPKEEVDMPVFFFIDPDILNDPSMENVNTITLGYTFFKTGIEEDDDEDEQEEEEEEEDDDDDDEDDD